MPPSKHYNKLPKTTESLSCFSKPWSIDHKPLIIVIHVHAIQVVREINYSKSGVQVKTEDGSVYQAKYVIVSVSVGVLQSDLIVFKPHLPVSSFTPPFPLPHSFSFIKQVLLNLKQQWKTQAIYEFDMAVYTKIFLRFPFKFWPSGPETEFFLYAHEKRGYYPIWQVHTQTIKLAACVLADY